MDTLKTLLDHQGILTVSIDVPGEPMNVLNQTMAEEFTDLLKSVDHDSAIKAVILISGRDNSFVAGADIGMLKDIDSTENGKQLSANVQELFSRIDASSKPFVAAIHGPCLGGGLELALACHYRLATDDERTQFGLPEVQLGLLPGGRGATLVPRMISLPTALDLLLTGKRLHAARARRIGLIDEIVSPRILADAASIAAAKYMDRKVPGRKHPIKDRLLRLRGIRDLVLKQARQQVMKTTHGLYPAPMAILDVVTASMSKSLRSALDMESTKFGQLAASPEAKQLINLYFASNELKKESFVKADVRPVTVNRVGILGGGLMGAGIALVSIDKAHTSVRMKDIHHDGILRAYRHLDAFYKKRIQQKLLSTEQAKKHINRLTGSLDYSGFAQCELVIEAVFEELNLKQQMVADIEALGNEQTVFASNTSSIPVGDIAAKAERPGNVVGMHYFSPVEKMPLLEIIRHKGTSDQAVATAVNFGKTQGKTVVVVRDGPGFYVNRILAPYVNAAVSCGMEGVAFDKIDRALVNFGFPVGPFRLLDEVGIDVGSKVQAILQEAFGERMQDSGLQKQFVENDRLGRKTKKGFYLYDKPKNRRMIDHTVYRELNVTPDNMMSPSTIVDRCLLMMLNEAVLCLEDKTISCPRDGDIAAIFGIGFPPFLGGPFRYMDNRGLTTTVTDLRQMQFHHGRRYAPAPLLAEMADDRRMFYDNS